MGAATGALTLPCELISSSSTRFTVGCPLICADTFVLCTRKPKLRSLLVAHLQDAKVLQQFFASLGHLFHSKHHAFFLSDSSSAFVHSLASVTVDLRALRRTIAPCAKTARPRFSSFLVLTLPTQCCRPPWNVAESSETSCGIRQGCLEACMTFEPRSRVVGSCAGRFALSWRRSQGCRVARALIGMMLLLHVRTVYVRGEDKGADSTLNNRKLPLGTSQCRRSQNHE